jgi:hypothetical protein
MKVEKAAIIQLIDFVVSKEELSGFLVRYTAGIDGALWTRDLEMCVNASEIKQEFVRCQPRR